MAIDSNLFKYLTKKEGHNLQEVAEAMGLSYAGLGRRLRGEAEFRRTEMEAWMQFCKVKDATAVFFPQLVACTQQTEEEM